MERNSVAHDIRVEPVTRAGRGRPFGSEPDSDAVRLGITQQEILLSGTAARFTVRGSLSPDGRWSLERGSTAAFRTRLLVTRPRDTDRFNGTVLLEWANVSSGYDMSLVMPYLTGSGFAHVLVSAQRDGLEGFPSRPLGMKVWDPERYGTLDIPDDALSYDIFTQAAVVLGPERQARSTDPLEGLAVQHVIAVGGSQSGSRVLAYANGVQPIEGAFDAFVPFLCAGHAADFTAARAHPDPGSEEYARGDRHSRAFPTAVRSDLRTPVLQINSEAEAGFYRPQWQPDSPTYRYWEVAGTAHAPRDLLDDVRRRVQLEDLPVPDWAAGAGSQASWGPVLAAALDQVRQWVDGGPPPPSQPLIEIDDAGIRRDRYGNALGGIRLPELEVPIARNVAANRLVEEGRVLPLADADLRELYGSDSVFRARFAEAADTAVRAGVLLPHHAQGQVESAQLPL